jgi:hypothetical protein
MDGGNRLWGERGDFSEQCKKLIHELWQGMSRESAELLMSHRLDQFPPAEQEEFMAKRLRTRQTGLQALAARFLQGRISKRQCTSNWACKTLSQQQIRYAATDAWISREIHLRAEKALPA